VRQHEADAATGDSVVLVWNQQALTTIAQTRTGPTVAARALAVMHTAIYDAWAAYDPVAVGTRLGATLRQPAAERTVDNKRRAVRFAAYAALVDLFPARGDLYAQEMADLGYAVDGSDTSTAAQVGRTAAQAVLDFRHRDGSNQLADEPGGTPGVAYSDYTGYQPVNTWNDVRFPDRWQPLCLPLPPPGATECAGRVQTCLTPQWSRVTPFALTSPGQFRPPGPYPYLDKDGKLNGQFVGQVDKMTQYSKQLDDTRKTYAEYWEDGPGSVTPPGHWNQFAQWVARRDAHTLDENARMLFALNGALLDAGIARWPTLKPASGGVDRTTPAASMPSVNGTGTCSWYAPVVCSRSAYETPAATTSITTPPSATGSSASVHTTPSRPAKFMIRCANNSPTTSRGDLRPQARSSKAIDACSTRYLGRSWIGPRRERRRSTPHALPATPGGAVQGRSPWWEIRP
jgi:hypothetical protein